jgi:hypothetical protein
MEMTKKSSMIFILALLLGSGLVLLSLDKGQLNQRPVPESAKYSYGGMAQAETSSMKPAVSSSPQPDRMVIASAFLTLEVKGFQEAYSGIYLIVQRFDGFIADSRSYETDSGSRRGTIVLRIPEEKFIDAVKEVEGVGHLKSKRITGRDVTEEYMDLGARLRNLEAQEGRLLDLLSKAGSIEDILKVEKELERVRGGIEQIKGRMQFLDNRVSMATVTVELYEPEPIKPVTSGREIRQALRKALKGFVETTGMLILALGTVLPVVILASLGFLAVKYYKKTRGRAGLRDEAPPV